MDQARFAKILVVEDHHMLLQVMETALRSVGYRVVACDNAATALQSFQEEPADLVIVDYVLPDLEGEEVAHDVKLLAPGTTVIVITGRLERTEAPSADLMLRKPFSIQQLLSSVLERVKVLQAA